MMQVLYFNQNLNIEQSLSARQLQNMKELNVVYVKDLYNFPARRWHTALELKRKWSNLDIMTCNTLVSVLPSPWRQFQKSTVNRSGSDLETIMTVGSVTKWAYKKLVKPKLLDVCPCENKWNVELGITPQWKKLCTFLTDCTKNIDLRWFQFRLLHKLLPTRKMLKTFQLTDDDQCVFLQRSPRNGITFICTLSSS